MQPEEPIQLGEIEPLSVSLQYQADPLSVLHTLQYAGGEHLLLESAEVDSKANLKSLLMIDAALRLTCMGQQVDVEALTSSGEVLLPYIAAQLPEGFEVKRYATRHYCIQCPTNSTALNEDERLRAPSNFTPLRVLQQLRATREHPFAVFLGGIFGYDLIASFEDLPNVETGHNNCPDYVFYLSQTLIVMDHQARTTELVGQLIGGDDLESRAAALYQRMGELSARLQRPCGVTPRVAEQALTVTTSPDSETFATRVSELKDAIRAGDIFQVVPSRQFRVPCNHALAAYQQLKADNPSPYMFYLRTHSFELFGASPESALKYASDTNQVELYPIAGTRGRGKDSAGQIQPDFDARIELALRRDEKELAEHMMLVDLARNDLARVAVAGTRQVTDLLKVDRYSHVMHLVSRVVAQLRPDLDALDAYRACMNMGTLTGAPKISASKLIRQVEQQRRGSYGGAVGYLTGQGDMDTCIVIRSALVRDGIAVVQAGAGVVYDSDPQAEVEETENKAQAVLQAIIGAQQTASTHQPSLDPAKVTIDQMPKDKPAPAKKQTTRGASDNFVSPGKLFLLDNQDSFTYNLVDELTQLGFDLEVYRNQLSADVILSKMEAASLSQPVMLCLSPGPGHPSEAGCMLDLLAGCQGRFPVLGICLGFQALVHQAGGRIDRCAQVMHGKTSAMHLQPHPIFAPAGRAALPNPLHVARYHSLQAFDVPPGVEIIAAVDDVPMVAYNASTLCLGFQFHPESLMTTYGSQLLHNTVEFLLSQGERLTCSF